MTYRHEGGRCSITGGVVYRGADSGLRGKYMFGDYCSGEIFLADPASGRFTVAVIEPAAALAFGITSFGEDERGNLYVVNHGLKTGNGGVYQISAAR